MRFMLLTMCQLIQMYEIPDLQVFAANDCVG